MGGRREYDFSRAFVTLAYPRVHLGFENWIPSIEPALECLNPGSGMTVYWRFPQRATAGSAAAHRQRPPSSSHAVVENHARSEPLPPTTEKSASLHNANGVSMS